KGRDVTIVGVTPPGFYGLEPGRAIDISVPLSLSWVQQGRLASPDVRFLRLIGRVRAGVLPARAESELTARWQALAAAARPSAPANRFLLLPGEQGLNDLRGQFSWPLR